MDEAETHSDVHWAHAGCAWSCADPPHRFCFVLQRWVFISAFSYSYTFSYNVVDRIREIRIWTTEGDVVSALSGHTSFVYSLTVLPTSEIASGGEDRTLRIWRGKIPCALPSPRPLVLKMLCIRRGVCANDCPPRDVGMDRFLYAKRRYRHWFK